MNTSSLLADLNHAQREAVSASSSQHVLVLSGAGSGKTRVLVHRIAWLLKNRLASPFEILAVTFTNKAAFEMRTRVGTLIGQDANQLWLGTFHSICHRLLRMHTQEAELSRSFQILDGDDQLRILRRVLKEQKVDDKKWPPKQVQQFINSTKDAGLRPHAVVQTHEPYVAMMQKLYIAYETLCQRSGVVDFAELILRTHELFRKNQPLKEQYQKRFRYILVDEFQDTNAIQYAWLKELAGPATMLFVVGDDDQSIYGWRGARIENIQRFGHDFKTCGTFRLEQNYRSTATILSAANAVIEHNESRLGKTLWTEGEKGSPITIYAAFDEIDEARFLVHRIQGLLEEGARLGEIAILYRSNAQSRILEAALVNAKLPYRIHGGLRFFDRAEVKDALGYLRLLANRHDDAAFERIINTPPRGLGEKTLAILRETARSTPCSLWDAAWRLLQAGSLAARNRQAIQNFLDAINRLDQKTEEFFLEELIKEVLQESGLIDFYLKEPGEKGRSRVENLEELVNAAMQFDSDTKIGYDGIAPLSTFLAQAALDSTETNVSTVEESVHLMTLHAAKGLEFPVVMMCGMEEGLFPHQMSFSDPAKLQEERRLCYVGITRAMRQLWMTYAEKRQTKGQESSRYPSRFLQEIPSELTQSVRFKTMVRRASPGYAMTISYPAKSKSVVSNKAVVHESGIHLGQSVRHPSFGKGVVLCFEGSSKQARVQVHFEKQGPKWLVLSYAKLEAIS